MPRYVKGDHAVETSNAREGVRLKAAGYAEAKDVQRSSGTSPRRKVASSEPSDETA